MSGVFAAVVASVTVGAALSQAASSRQGHVQERLPPEAVTRWAVDLILSGKLARARDNIVHERGMYRFNESLRPMDVKSQAAYRRGVQAYMDYFVSFLTLFLTFNISFPLSHH
jgi:hypothetical protein